MKRQQTILWVLACLLAVSGVAFAERNSDKSEVSETVLRNLTEDEQNRQLAEMRRSMTNIERRIDRFDDRIQKLDHDLKELKRKI